MNRTLLILLLATLFIGCKKDETAEPSPDPDPSGTLNLNIDFSVDGTALQFDTIAYINAAGNEYSVYTLVFYLSKIELIKQNGSALLLKNWHYVDARTGNTLNLQLTDIPNGNYTGIRFNIGLDAAQNISGSLPATAENLAMEWPDAMGGGYHFLKLEGYFNDSTGTPGYAMHLGTDSCLVTANPINYNFSFDGNVINKTLVMNINEWYRNPQVYDLNADGNYSMGNMLLMQKLRNNGKDVFTIE
jgi:hypothetical protein